MTDSFERYMFTSDVTNFVCPEWLFGHYTWKYLPPNACATDPSTTTVCAGDGRTSACSSGTYTWCCLRNKESCTQLSGQVNVCFSLAHNTLSNISGSVLNATYSSLSSAQPLASSYSFDPLALIAETQPTSTQIVTATNSTGHANDNSTSDSLSGGAIAGIVIGVVAAIAIAGIATFLLWRRRQKKRNRPAQAMTPADPKYAKPAQEHRGHSGHIPREMEPETNQATELPGNQQCYPPQELATNP